MRILHISRAKYGRVTSTTVDLTSLDGKAFFLLLKYIDHSNMKLPLVRLGGVFFRWVIFILSLHVFARYLRIGGEARECMNN